MSEKMNADQLSAVFRACDRSCKGYITFDDAKYACEQLTKGDEERILHILDIRPGLTLDLPTFTSRVGRYLEQPSGCLFQSPLLNKQKKPKAGLLSSPFSPLLNSSEYLDRYAARKRQRESLSPATFQGNGEEADNFSLKLRDTARRPKKLKRSRIYEADLSSYKADLSSYKAELSSYKADLSSYSNQTGSPNSSSENDKMAEIREKLDAVEESTVQTKHELSSIFQFINNRSVDLKEDIVAQQRIKIRDLQGMEMDILRMKMEGQQFEMERLKTANNELSSKITGLDEERQSQASTIKEQSSQIKNLEEKLNLSRNEKSSLFHHLEDAKRGTKRLEAELETVEEWRTFHAQEVCEARWFLEAEQNHVREEKALIIQERDILRRTVAEVYRDKEELIIERINFDMDLERFRLEKEQFLILKSDLKMSGRSEEFVMIETSAEVDNILLENKILKENLDQIAKEKTGLQEALKIEKDKLKTERSLTKSSNKVRQVYCEKDNLQEMVREKERVISSLMDVVENLKKEQANHRSIKEHERNLREITGKIRETANKMETLVQSSLQQNKTSCRRLSGTAIKLNDRSS